MVCQDNAALLVCKCVEGISWVCVGRGLVDNTVISWIPYIGSVDVTEWCGLWLKERGRALRRFSKLTYR